MREPENSLIKTYYPAQRVIERGTSHKSYKPPSYRLYGNLLPGPYVVDARRYDINNRMVNLYK